MSLNQTPSKAIAHLATHASTLLLATVTSTLLLGSCGSRTENNPTDPSPQEKSESEMRSPEAKKKTPLTVRSLRRLSATEIEAIKPIEQKTGRFAECGVEEYQQRVDALCGVQEYHLRSSRACAAIVKEDAQFGAAEYRLSTGEPCGAAEYFSKPDEACGVDKEEFWSQWDQSCPSGYASGSWFSALSNTETRIHRVSWTDIRAQTRHLCLRATPKTCALPQFGVKQFNSCRNPAFGVERYNAGVVGFEACRSESHGVESYKTCRHETFGVDKHKSCSLYLTQPELDGYLKAQSDVLPALGSSMIDSAAIFYSNAGKQKALACLVKEIVENPQQQALAEDLKNRYFILTDRFWSEAEAQECARGFVEIDNAECADNDVGITCTALSSFRKLRNAMLTTRKNLTLLSEEARNRGNAAAAEAVNDLLRAAR